MQTKAILVALCLVVTGIAAIFAIPPARAATYINDQLMEERGATGALGGGEHVFLRFGTDAAFGIVYGTGATNPNNIYVVAIKARYLGVAQVVDSQGRSVLDNRAIKIYTLYAMKLDSIVEFRDSNGNNAADYGRLYNSSTNRFSDYFNRGDVLYKKVDLNTNWTAGAIARTNGTGYRTWTFDLSARNLSYSAVANNTAVVTGVLPLVRFTFHLNASVQQVTNVSVPQWNITVSSGSTITKVTRGTDLLVSGKAVHYDLKWDQDIEGWTFAAGNGAGNARRLLLEVGAIVGNFIPAALADQWLENRVLGPMHEAGAAQFNSTVRAADTANDTTGTYSAVRRLTSPNVDFGANWTRIGRFLWAGTSVVDGVLRVVYGQIVAGLRFAAVGENGNRFVGFVLLVGLSFRGGASVVHDPIVTADVQADLALPTPSSPGVLFIIAVVAGALLIGTVFLVALLLIRRRKKGIPPPDSSPPPPPPD